MIINRLTRNSCRPNGIEEFSNDQLDAIIKIYLFYRYLQFLRFSVAFFNTALFYHETSEGSAKLARQENAGGPRFINPSVFRWDRRPDRNTSRDRRARTGEILRWPEESTSPLIRHRSIERATDHVAVAASREIVFSLIYDASPLPQPSALLSPRIISCVVSLRIPPVRSPPTNFPVIVRIHNFPRRISRCSSVSSENGSSGVAASWPSGLNAAIHLRTD